MSTITERYARLEERVTAWVEDDPTARAAVVIGSRARTDHPADEWADLDVVMITSDIGRFIHDRTWLERVGEPKIAFRGQTPGADGPELRVLFDGGLDVDFAFMAPEHVEHLMEHEPRVAAMAFGRGFRILVDKDGLARRMTDLARSTGEPAQPPEPDAGAFAELCSEFWYHTVWTAKHLRRGELWWAKSCCDGMLKEHLRQLLEWEAAAAGRDPWFRGRFFEEWADPGVLAGLRKAFARYDEAEVWAALATTMDLFGEVGPPTAERLGFEYDSAAEAEARTLVAGLRPSAGEGGTA
jgi:aminoglycoside 6-adenylyltransferase